MERIIWSSGRFCTHCGSTDTIKIRGKSARPGLYQCRDCREQFTVTVGTVFHSTKIPLQKWFLAMFLMGQSSKGMSTKKISEWLDLPYKTAWHLTHRIRAMMAEGDEHTTILTGIVELDETYVGGKPRPGRDKNRKRGRGTEKQGVFVAVERGGRVKAELIASHGREDIEPLVKRFVDPGAQLMTDELPTYRGIGRDYRYHYVVSHAEGEYAREGQIHVNTAESFNSTLKRAVVGVFHYISKKHMIRYVNEACFRWNTRDGDRVREMLRLSVGRRLPYAFLVEDRIESA